MTKKTISVVLPYAVSIRDFVNSGVLLNIARDPKLEVTLYTLNPELPELSSPQLEGVKVKAFTRYSDTWIEAKLKTLYLYFFADQFSKVSQKLTNRPLRFVMSKILVVFRKVLGVRKFLRLYAMLLAALYRRRHLAWQIEGKPDLLVGTRSLLNSLDYGIIAEAHMRGINVVTIASSWDNFTSKGFFPFNSRHIVVWNRKMQAELVDIFGVPENMITIAGYPRQLNLKKLSKGISSAEYLNQIGCSNFSRFILYSASYSELTKIPCEVYPLEYQVMVSVCKQLEVVLPEDVCILLRLHPFSDTKEADIFECLGRSFVFVPGRQDKYVERLMGIEDERHLSRQIALSECVISMASTITIDALSLDKNVLNTQFDPRPDIPYMYSIDRFYQYNHIRDLVKLVELPVARNLAEVITYVDSVLDGNVSLVTDMIAFEKNYVPMVSMRYVEIVSGTLKEQLI